VTTLLDPKNDFVFKRIFADSPDLLGQLISDIRHQHPPVKVVQVLNPEIKPEELTGKFIVLDILAEDTTGKRYNIEIQVCHYDYWSERGSYYLARTYGQQLLAGDDYTSLKPIIGIHLLNFRLFSPANKATWSFQLRDKLMPEICFGDGLQLEVVELPKADRLGLGGDALSQWITMLRHWNEEQRMADIEYPPVRQALGKIRELSADEEAKRLAFVRERAIRDEKAALSAALKRGLAKGLERGLTKGKREGLLEGKQVGLLEGKQVGLLEGKQVGLLEGELAGKRAQLQRQISRKFSALPDTYVQQLNIADNDQLDECADRILTASTLDELFGNQTP
jgi:predicted transposase/invertase (TIGR01784 family)